MAFNKTNPVRWSVNTPVSSGGVVATGTYVSTDAPSEVANAAYFNGRNGGDVYNVSDHYINGIVTVIQATPGQAADGTVAVNTSGTVTGTGTNFRLFKVGDAIGVSGAVYTIASISSPTSMTLESGPSSNVSAGASFTHMKSFGGDGSVFVSGHQAATGNDDVVQYRVTNTSPLRLGTIA